MSPKHGLWIRNGAPHDPTETLELAVAAEAAGWDGVFVSDAVQESHTEPFTLLAAVAARTTTVALGTWVTPLVARDVVHVARSAANVDRLSGGRLVLGFGLGNATEHDGLGIGRTARERELQELLPYYREQGGDGVVMLPRLSRFGSDYDELCTQLGADWLLTCDPPDLEAVRAGPPG